jgi:hypothetical protein
VFDFAFVHPKLVDGDIYFLDNRSDLDATFRVAGKAPELWHAENGKLEPASYSIANGYTMVPLHLEPWGTVFVVFRKPAAAFAGTLPAMTESSLATISGPWDLSFQPNRGAPASVSLAALQSWATNAGSGIRYFSGTGTYTKTIDA